MRNRIILIFTIVIAAVICSLAWAQSQNASSNSDQSSGAQSGQQSMHGMDLSNHDMSNMPGMSMGDKNDKGGDAEADKVAGAHAMHSMEGHMDMGPHMKMTALRPSKPGDAARAQQVVEAARKASEKYTDYHVALDDGFRIFLPNVPQKMYHFTNYRYGMEARFRFNPEHPTSLLYEKHGDDYKLIGVMYTAPKTFTEGDLDQRIPLSIAQWHEHVNFCLAPPDKRGEGLGPHPQFGLKGSITTQEACDAAGGTFHPVVFNWMVHVYPFEKDQAAIWSVERQHGDAD
jgi:hypothetical protein